MARRRILALSFFPAYLPPRSGGVERLFRIYSLLSEQFDVTLISSGEVGGEVQTIVHGTSFEEIRVPKGPEFLRVYQDLQPFSGAGDLSGPAIGLSSRTSGTIHDVYLSHYASADVIIHDSPFLVHCDLFRGFDQKVRVYNTYNCETDLYASFHSSSDKTRHIETVVAELESDLCRHADLITTCSEEDRERFKTLFDPIAPIEIVPNGVIPVTLDERRKKPSGNRLVFIGSNHKPNVEAANFIISELAPAFPNFEFHVVGSCHEPMRSKNVVAHGVVEAATKKDLLQTALAAINPIVTGGGSSLKVADIAASGTPLVSTKLGVRGFDLRDGEHYLALSKEQFLANLDARLSDATTLAKLAETARRHIVERFAWPVIVDGFVDRLRSLLESKSAPRPYLVINDYDSLATTGGGGTRTLGLCRGLAESRPVIFLSFAERGEGGRRVSPDGRILSLAVAKTDEHVAAQAAEDQIHWVSTADVLNYRYAPLHPRLSEIFRCAASASDHVICEHPYMVGLPRMYGLRFVYSSHNFELGLKAELLREHPNARNMIADVREAEEYSCAASYLIVAVSDEDARQLSGTYRFTAPTIVIRNGSDVGEELPLVAPAKGARPSAIFMGSGHGPNVDAAQWIVQSLAPAMPEVEFRIVGSVSDMVAKSASPNVTAVGTVSTEEKGRQLVNSTVALNPIERGSGSNIKIADYLQHGLPVLSTTFGSRGYEDVPRHDLCKVPLDAFASELSRLLRSDAGDGRKRLERAARYRDKLSMVEGGRRLDRELQEHFGERRRALYVTYRYNDPPLGGGEFYVDRLVTALAKDGWFVDVVSPEAESIRDLHRFGAEFTSGSFQPVAVGRERVRSAKFPIDGPKPGRGDFEKVWRAQPDFEEAYVRGLPNRPDRPALAWGWGDPQERNRWCFINAGVYAPEAAQLALQGTAPAKTWIELLSDAGELVHQQEVAGEFKLECRLPSGFTRVRVSLLQDAELSDPRPLAALVNEVKIGSEILTFQSQQGTWGALNEPMAHYAAYAKARKEVRDKKGLALSALRNPSSSLIEFIDEAIGQYNLLITHNAIFGSTTEALRRAEQAGVPSILVPHLHLDDDFYHFGDVIEACRKASQTLACPSSTARFLTEEGLTNVSMLTPGIDAREQFTPEDAKAFRAVLGRDDDFVLVLGRKARAKGYADTVESVGRMRGDRPIVVMIGPDDDGLPLPEGDVIYLGQQSREVVRGALMECLALVNMSRSESFGIVLLEAGLAGKPVLANRNCAAFADVVEDGVNGLLVTRDDLHLKLRELVQKPKLRERLGAAGRKAALAYDWTEIERRFVNRCNEFARA